MDRLLAYENAGEEPPMVVFGAHPDGPGDLLDEPMEVMELSLADKAKLGIELEPDQGFNNEHLQWELRMALERIHTNAGHEQHIGGAAPAKSKPFDGMDSVSSALLMELAATVMPEQPPVCSNEAKYTPAQRKIAIKRWKEKRSRRHLISQTKYRKMKDVAVGKARCKGGKFIKKSERERLALLTKDEIAQVSVDKDPWKDPWQETSAWDIAYNFYARSEE